MQEVWLINYSTGEWDSAHEETWKLCGSEADANVWCERQNEYLKACGAFWGQSDSNRDSYDRVSKELGMPVYSPGGAFMVSGPYRIEEPPPSPVLQRGGGNPTGWTTLDEDI